MDIIKEVSQLKENIDTLERYLNGKTDPEYTYALDLIKRGVCFVAVEQEGGRHFYPSRFIGYMANTRDKHMNNEYKDGKETNPAISAIIGKKPVENTTLDMEYKQYCEKLGFTAWEKGAFGVARKYWVLKDISCKN